MTERPAFEIGLTMAGAISAGAYSAGVIDFLFEALDAIEDVRAGRPQDYLSAGLAGENPIVDPPHDVKIKAMSGASAGSMVTAIVSTVLGARVPPVTAKRKASDTGSTENPLYDAWVEQIHYDKLLSTGDIDAPAAHVVSLLNSVPLEGIVKGALEYARKSDYVRPYIGETLPMFFCVSNLRGVRYAFPLDTSSGVPREYQMSLHADWLEFKWTKKSSVDGVASLVPGAFGKEWTKLGNAALASGAFPVGLSARSLFRDFGDYEQRKWYDAGTNTERLYPPLDKRKDFQGGLYEFVNADGGIFDNEPLELCRAALSGGAANRNSRDPLLANRGLILIDPFPNLISLEDPYAPEPHRQLLDVVKNLLGAMIAQGRFKLDEIALAAEPNVASRYAIMPIRYDAKNKIASYALACGSLGGFGGFLSKTFRHHDFMLGRRNCQRFLSNHFVLPADWDSNTVNPLFAGWEGQSFTDKFQVTPDSEPGDKFAGKKYLPIVPLLGKLASPDYTKMPDWPAAPFDLKREELRKAILGRMEALKASLIKQYKPGWILRLGIEAGWMMKKCGLADRALDLVEADLSARGIQLS